MTITTAPTTGGFGPGNLARTLSFLVLLVDEAAHLIR